MCFVWSKLRISAKSFVLEISLGPNKMWWFRNSLICWYLHTPIPDFAYFSPSAYSSSSVSMPEVHGLNCMPVRSSAQSYRAYILPFLYAISLLESMSVDALAHTWQTSQTIQNYWSIPDSTRREKGIDSVRRWFQWEHKKTPDLWKKSRI